MVEDGESLVIGSRFRWSRSGWGGTVWVGLESSRGDFIFRCLGNFCLKVCKDSINYCLY